MKKFIFFAVVVVLFNVSAFVYSQGEEESKESSPIQSSQEISLPEVSPPQPDKLIKEIEIKGNKLISSATIISKIKTRVNQPYFSRIVKDDIKRLYDTGFFSDVSIDDQDFQDGLKVIITVTEKAVVGEVVLEGMHRLRPDLAEEKFIKTKAEQYLDYNQLREDAQSLKNEYQKRGFQNAEVDYKVEIDPATSKAKVIFVVGENARVRIKRVYILGNNNVDKNKIIRAMKTRQARIFHAGFFKEGEFSDDLERIKILYNIEGFPDAKIDSRFEYDDLGFMYIHIVIEEGRKYTVGEVNISGNKDFSTDELRGQLKEAVPGEVFSEAASEKDAFNLHNFYLSKGYLFVQIRKSSSIEPETNKVNISYNIIENEIAYVEKIDIRGNTKTKDKVIRREIRLKPGERFDGDKLKRSKERLDNLGFFQEVTFDTEPGTAPNRENLIVDVKEAQTGSFSFGGGYSTIDQFVGFIEVEQKNFDLFNFPYFTGAGQDLLLRWEIGSVRENFDLSFTEPWFFDQPLSFGFDAYKRTHDRETDVGYAFDEERTGGALRLGKEFSEYVRGNLVYRLEQISISDFADNVSSEFIKEEGDTVLSSMSFDLTRDTRDNIFNPTKGLVLSGLTEITGGPFGGDKNFLKLFTTSSRYFGFWEKSVIEAKLRAGALLTFGDTDDVPIYERFYAGGADTIRGYNERKVGPIDPVSEDPIGGESILLGNLEYTYAILDFLKLAAFLDVGNVWRKVEDFASGDFKSGIGFGVRIKTPIGPMKLDYGFPLSTEPGEEGKEGKFHFSMSKTF